MNTKHTRSARAVFCALLLPGCLLGDPDQPESPAALGATAQQDAYAATQQSVLPYRGVNLAGADFSLDANGAGSQPCVFGTSYTYPDPAYGYQTAGDFIGKGMTTFRLPFRWECLQPRLRQPFDAAELTRLRTTVRGLTQKGAKVLLDPHNYARYYTDVIGSGRVSNSDFADFWARLAGEFKNDPNVLFGLINEPHDLPSTEQWVSAANAAIAAIRGVGANNLVLVPGNSWTGAGTWEASFYGTPNATALLAITDPKNNYAFEVHQYLDADASGTSPTCVSATIGSQSMQGFTRWLRAHGKKGFLGEFGGGANATCLSALDDILTHLEKNADVYLGWTYWAAGPWWGNYFTSLEPSGGKDAMQMGALLPHLRRNGGGGGGGACAPATYEAEDMSHSTGGATAGGWNLWSDGYLATNVTLGAGTVPITVTAKGESAAGGWPHLVLSLAGATLGATTVSSAGWAEYTFRVPVSADTKELRVIFDNDYYQDGEDRNLLIDKVVVGCPGQ